MTFPGSLFSSRCPSPSPVPAVLSLFVSVVLALAPPLPDPSLFSFSCVAPVCEPPSFPYTRYSSSNRLTLVCLCRRPALPPAVRAPHRAEPERQDRPPAPPAPAQPTAVDARAEPEGGTHAEEAVRATGWGDAETAESQEALAEATEVEARGWTEPPRKRDEGGRAGARQRERRGGRQEERTRPAEGGNAADEEAAQETQMEGAVEGPGAPTGWGGDVVGPSGVQSERMAYPEDERGPPRGPRAGEYAEMGEQDYGVATAYHAQPTGWAEEGEAERGGPYQGHPHVVPGNATNGDRRADVSMEYEESWDGEDDASASEGESSPRGGLGTAPARIGVQDVRVVEGTLPATALKRSTVNPTLLPGTQAAEGRAQDAARRMEVGVQDARLLPVERSERLERRKSRKRGGKAKREKELERRRRSSGSRTPQGASPGGDFGERAVLPGPLRQTPLASGNNTPSPSKVPPSGWSAGGGSPVTPASILQAVEQPSPGGRSSRLRKEGGGRRSKDQAESTKEGRTWQESAEASVRERGSKRADASLATDTGAGILGRGGPVSRVSEEWPGEPTGKQASSQHRSAGNARSTRPDSGRDVSQDSSYLQRDEGSSRKREAVSDAIETARKESDAGGGAGDADKQSSGSGGQRGSSGQSGKRAVRPSGVWSVRDRRETSTSSA